jgi:hypothetical protein
MAVQLRLQVVNCLSEVVIVLDALVQSNSTPALGVGHGGEQQRLKDN